MSEAIFIVMLTVCVAGFFSTFPSRQERRVRKLELAIREARLKRELIEVEGRHKELI